MAGSGAEASTPEFYTRLLALPLGPARDPRLAVALAIAVQLPALGVLYEVLQRHGGVRLAALAGVLIGSAPWAVLLARRVSPAALAVPLATLLLAGLISALCERRPWGWTLAWVSALTLCVLSVHGVPALLLLALVSVLWQREVRWPFVLLGVLLWLLLTLSTLYDCPACGRAGVAPGGRRPGQACLGPGELPRRGAGGPEPGAWLGDVARPGGLCGVWLESLGTLA